MASAGDLITLRLDDRAIGHEQQGDPRTALVLRRLDRGRFETLLVAPTSSEVEKWRSANAELYPVLPRGSGSQVAQGSIPARNGLDLDSVVLLDQLQCIDPERVIKVIGHIDQPKLKQIMLKIAVMLGFGVR